MPPSTQRAKGYVEGFGSPQVVFNPGKNGTGGISLFLEAGGVSRIARAPAHSDEIIETRSGL